MAKCKDLTGSAVKGLMNMFEYELAALMYKVLATTQPTILLTCVI